MSIQDEIESIELEIRKTPYHKATQAHIGRLKAKLARLRSGQQSEKEAGTGKGRASGMAVKKSGDATVLLVGFPSVGKSTLINRLTNAQSKTADYDFTTLDVIPGMLEYNSAKIQLLDIPGMIMGASKGRGKGKQILSVIRNADLILLVIDDEHQLDAVREELHSAGFRLDRHKPDVKITKRFGGGLDISLPSKHSKRSRLDKATIRSVLAEFKIHDADVVIREDIDVDQLVDSLMHNRVYVKSMVVLNKSDIMDDAGLSIIERRVGDCVPISALHGRNLECLREEIWKRLGLIRVYMKRIGHDPDMAEPLIMKGGDTVHDVARKILKNQSGRLKYARIWGPTARFGGQQVGPRHQLKDKDIVELHA